VRSGLRILDTYIKQTETSRVKMELESSKRSFRTKYNPIKSEDWCNLFGEIISLSFLFERTR
jgi:hypothetical protein